MRLSTQYGVTISAGNSLSSIADLEQFQVTGFLIPSTWTAANLSFQGSVDGINFFDIFNATGSEVTVTVTASKLVVIDEDLLEGVRFLKVRSGLTGAPVVQASTVAVIMIGVSQ